MAFDLHAHSTASDGTDAPQALAALARRAGLEGLALTDHDTTAGCVLCAEACRGEGLEFLGGIELSCDPTPGGGTLHLLGYGFDPASAGLIAATRRLREGREKRLPLIVAKLAGLGVDIDMEEVLRQAGEAAPGRPHVARVLLEKGYVKTLQDAFTRYLGEQGAAYVPKERLAALQAIRLIHQAGGVVVLAHPVQWKWPQSADLRRAVAGLVEAGLDGIEVHHPDHEPRDIERFSGWAEKMDLLVTAGSDYHGRNRPVALGAFGVTRAQYARILERRTRWR